MENTCKIKMELTKYKWCTETNIACEEFYFAQPIKAYENSSEQEF